MRKTFAKSDQRGFTLLEVIVAGAIIAGVMLSIEPLLVSSMRTDKETQYRVRAQQAVVQQLDNLISSSSCTNGSTSGTNYVDAATGIGSDTLPDVPVVITRTWTVNAPDPACDIYDPTTVCQCVVSVNVSYTDRGGTKTYALSSLKGK